LRYYIGKVVGGAKYPDSAEMANRVSEVWRTWTAKIKSGAYGVAVR
jgi:hypothetical protein